MIDLFKAGGPLFMTLISICLVGIFVFILLHVSGKGSLNLVKECGLLVLAVGILGQLLGLFRAFEAIQAMGQVSTAMLVGGLKVSMISTLYGFIGFLISRLYIRIARFI